MQRTHLSTKIIVENPAKKLSAGKYSKSKSRRTWIDE